MSEHSEEFKRFNNIMTETDAEYHEAARKLGLSDSAMLILYMAASSGGKCPLSDITKLSGISKQTINSAVRKLEQSGDIVLRQATGRKKTLYLTDRGKETAERTVARLIDIENKILRSWTEEERSQYLELSQKYLFMLREEIEKL